MALCGISYGRCNIDDVDDKSDSQIAIIEDIWARYFVSNICRLCFNLAWDQTTTIFELGNLNGYLGTTNLINRFRLKYYYKVKYILHQQFHGNSIYGISYNFK